MTQALEPTDEQLRQLLYADPVVEIVKEPNELTAAADVHEGAMVALIPAGEDIDRLALPNGEPDDQLHLTLFYLGDAAAIDDQTRQDIIDAVTDALDNQPTIVATAFGASVFNPLGDEPCLTLLVSGDVLADVHMSVEMALEEADANLAEQHQPWIPHITLAYIDEPWRFTDKAVERLGDVTFDRVRVAFADETTDIQLGDNVLIAGALTEPFHLGGKHNQKSHGHGGGGPLATVDDSKIKKARASYDDRLKGAKTEGDAYTAVGLGQGFPSDKTREGVRNDEITPAVGKYAGSTGHHDVNQGLRDAHGDAGSVRRPTPQTGAPPSPIKSDEELRDVVATMDRGMDASHLSDDIVVHRVIANPDGLFGSAYHRDGDNSGLTWMDHGFTSTTIASSSVGFQSARLKGGQDESMGPQIHMRILAPKGTHAMLGNNAENEVILDRGLRFRVVRDYGIDDRTRRDMELGITKGYLRQIDVEIIE